jgi:hypothetical protein
MLNVIMLSVVILLVVAPNMPLHQSRVSRLTIHDKLTNKVVLIRSYQNIPITHLSTKCTFKYKIKKRLFDVDIDIEGVK